MIVINNLSKCYGTQRVLDGIELTIERASITALLGPSGCGKSSLLRLLLGLIAPTTGTIRIEQTEINPRSAPSLRLNMGYVIQEGGLFPHLTAKQNIIIMPRFLKWSKQRTEERVAQLVALTRFPTDRLDHYPGELSGGQRQRIALMRALMLDPEHLLLDEPLGALDPLIRYELQSELKDIFRRLRKTVVLVTHDLHEADYLADDVVLMHDGRIQQRGSMTTLFTQPACPFVERFTRAHLGHAQRTG